MKYHWEISTRKSLTVITQTEQVPFNSPSCFLLAASELALLAYKELTTLPLSKKKKKADTHLPLCPQK